MKDIKIIFSCMALVLCDPLWAFNYNLGVKSWVSFFNENPGLYGDKHHPDFDLDAKTEDSINSLPMLNLNPTANIRFDNKNSLAINLMIGTTEVLPLAYEIAPSENQSNDTLNMSIDSIDANIWKFDADILYNRRLTNQFTFFTGMKYIQIHSTAVYSLSGFNPPAFEAAGITSFTDKPTYMFDQYSIGPGLGFGFNTAITGNIFFLSGISESLLYSMTSHTYDRYTSTEADSVYEGQYLVPATNAKVSCAYFLASSRTTLDLGLQGQYMYYISQGGSGPEAMLDGTSLYLFGPVFSVIFSF